MGNDCSCLNNCASLCSEDLSNKGNKDMRDNYINNNPKKNLMDNSILEKKELDFSNNDIQSINSSRNVKINKRNKNNRNKSQLDDGKKSEQTDLKTNTNTTFKTSIDLNKYFLRLIAKKNYLKYYDQYKKEAETLFNLCIKQIFNSNDINDNISKAEKSCSIKYNRKGYKEFYPNLTQNEEKEKMEYIPNESKTIDNSIIIIYHNNEDNERDEINGINNYNNIDWCYKGQANLNNLPNGYGEKYIKNGIKQKGYWKEGQLIGWSQSIDFKGNLLIGPFIDGEVTGKGIKYSLTSNTLYKGDIVQNKKSGKGEEISPEGTYSGFFSNDKKNGEGKMVFSLTGDIYEGNYKDDLFDGQGHYIWKISGQEYTGEYKSGLMHGKGLYEWSEGEYYRGSFVNGKKEGKGEMHWADGRSFIGPFVNGRPQGVGIFDNGVNFKGEIEFIDGKLNRNYINQNKGSESNSGGSSDYKKDNYL